MDDKAKKRRYKQGIAVIKLIEFFVLWLPCMCIIELMYGSIYSFCIPVIKMPSFAFNKALSRFFLLP